jgi:hypothetical protein
VQSRIVIILSNKIANGADVISKQIRLKVAEGLLAITLASDEKCSALGRKSKAQKTKQCYVHTLTKLYFSEHLIRKAH